MLTNINIPQSYGDNKIVLMVRDPWTIFSYWEIRKNVEDEISERIRQKGLAPSKSVLRMYEVEGAEQELNMRIFCEYDLNNWISSWYVHTDQAGKKWMAEVGIIADNGEFFCLARSNMVTTPSHVISDVLDAEWMCSKDIYNEMLSSSQDVGKSSLDLTGSLERYLRKWLSSGGISSGMFSGTLLSRGNRKK